MKLQILTMNKNKVRKGFRSGTLCRREQAPTPRPGASQVARWHALRGARYLGLESSGASRAGADAERSSGCPDALGGAR